MTDEEPDTRDDLAVRAALLLVPVTLTARLLDVWAPKPLSWTVSTLAWMLLIYWFPRRATFDLRRWLIIVSISVAAVLIIAILQPDLL
ncbi:MAG TPA: hypothetical protein VNO50_21290 [Pyrinomonadaceae bacterium]|nr:hypothetical protein [Pyrinomonadaceae bacterium]